MSTINLRYTLEKPHGQGFSYHSKVLNLNLNSKHGRNSQLCQQAQALPAHTWRATFQLYPRATVRWCTYSNVSTFHTTTEPATKKSFWSSVLVWVAVYSHVSKNLWNPYLFIIYSIYFWLESYQSPSSWKKVWDKSEVI